MRRLKSYSRTSLRFTAVGGQRVLNSYQQLRSLVLKRLQRPDIADLFSTPEEDAGKHEFVWYTSLPGTITGFEDLPADQRQQREAELEARLVALRDLARQLRAEAGAERRSLEAEIIEAATSIPDDSCKFMVGDQPVLAAWGASLVKSNRASVDVVWTGEAPPQPAGRVAAAAQAGAAGTATAATTATVAGASRPWSFAWTRNLVWLLPLLAGVLLVALAYRLGPLNLDFDLSRFLPSFSAPAPAPTLGTDSREADLRREIAELKKQLESKLDACPVPPGRSGSTGTGPTLAIPPQSLAKKDSSFLSGCWNAPSIPVIIDPSSPNETSDIAEVVLCFDPDGKTGKRTIRSLRISCEGSLSATLADRSVTIAAPQMQCDQGRTFSAATIVCSAEGNQTSCKITQPSKPDPIDVTFTKREQP